MNRRLFDRRIIVSPCYDHLGGLLGESLLRFFLKEKLIKRFDEDYIITDNGWEELEIIGIDINNLSSSKRKIVNICYESNHGIFYEHLGAHLGTLLLEKMIELNWIEKKDDKTFMLTQRGLAGLDAMGVKIKNIWK